MSAELLRKELIGEVVDIDDPKRFGRVRVAITNLTDDIPIENLPFYWVDTGVKANNQGGVIPELNSWVLVKFENTIYDGKVIQTLTSKPAIQT